MTKPSILRFTAVISVLAFCIGLLVCSTNPNNGKPGHPKSATEPGPSPVSTLGSGTTDSREVGGTVVDEYGQPLEFATVRIQATKNQCLTDSRGRFTLSTEGQNAPFTVSAWKDKYYCAKQENVEPGQDAIRLVLLRYQTNDNPDYEWVTPRGEGSCFSCKPAVTQVWLEHDAHARSAINPRFISMYTGTDIRGNRSPNTRYIHNRDYGEVPLPPNPNKPYFGPGYKLDFPDADGNCAACHLPGAALEDPYGTDPTRAEGVDRFGIHCDFCHKIADVELDPASGLPYPNMPGVLSIDIRRPFPDDPERYQLFFGTFDDDNVPEEDTRLPLIERSQFCAACHFGVFWNTVIYNSFGEWLESSYSDPISGQTCQDCHMPAPTYYQGKAITNVAPDGMGGVERDPLSIHAHTFPGAADVELLQNAVTMHAETERVGEEIRVVVRITNDLTGHHVPTDSPLRHLILLVEAEDFSGRPLELLEGGILPDWCGKGDPDRGYYAGLPGRAYAKVLMELWTEIYPSGSYWNPTILVSDNRLAAYATDTSRYVFAAPTNGGRITVRLFYRRAYIELADQKGWEISDILMEQEVRQIPK
jgi:hypothetical protein